jgi:hypothetical protein
MKAVQQIARGLRISKVSTSNSIDTIGGPQSRTCPKLPTIADAESHLSELCTHATTGCETTAGAEMAENNQVQRVLYCSDACKNHPFQRLLNTADHIGSEHRNSVWCQIENYAWSEGNEYLLLAAR